METMPLKTHPSTISNKVKDKHVVLWQLEAPLKILCIGDLHIGNPSYSGLSPKDFAELAQEYYFILLGDLFEMVTKNSVGNIYTQKLSPQEQLEFLDLVFEKIKDKVLGVVGGNHDFRMTKEVGVDPLQVLCSKWKIPYSPYFLIVDLVVRKGSRVQSFVLALHHGVAGGRSKSTSIRQGEYFERFIVHGIDVYISGHTHKPSIFPFSHRVYNNLSKKIEMKTGYLITIPAFISEADYALKKMLEPSSQEIPVINIDLNLRKTQRKMIDVSLIKLF